MIIIRVTMVILLLLACLVNVVVEGAISHHEIDGTKLPGWNKQLPSKQYSGYIHLNQLDDNYNNIRKHLHYWFVESEHDPLSDPVILWLNGGPGCSSLIGYLNEMGPLQTNRKNYKGGIPQLVYNKWTWTKMANVIFLEAPVGTGYSYSERSIKLDDFTTAQDNYQFLIEWFKSYSEYRNNDFYIIGESYAGIYIPLLVHKVMETEQLAGLTSNNKINLKGFAVGNGCIGSTIGSCINKWPSKYHVDYLYNHGLFPTAIYRKMKEECSDYLSPSTACSNLIKEMSNAIGRVNAYGIYKGCSSNKTSTYFTKTGSLMSEPLPMSYDYDYTTQFDDAQTMTDKISGPVDCLDDELESLLLNHHSTRHALHVASVGHTGKWSSCRENYFNKIYHHSALSVLSIYPKIIKKYRTLIYNGNTDSVVPYIQDEEWTSGLGFEIRTPWKAWMIRNQVVGYVTEYNVNSFKFIIVHGAGHMVPEDKPEESFEMIRKFLMNKEF